MRVRSIRTRLTLWYTSLLALTFVLLGGAAYTLVSYNLSHDVDTSLAGVARVLADQARRGETAFPPPDIDDAFRRFFGFSPWDRFFDLVPPGRPGPQGNRRLPLSEKAMRNASEGLPTLETVTGLAPYPVRIMTMPVIQGGRVVNLVQVGMSLEMSYNTRHSFLLTMAAIFPVALLLAGGGGWLLARRALRPVDQMAEAARRISAEHLATRLEDTGANDELSRLAKTLNEMLSRLDASFRQIRQFSADASHELQTPLTILKGEIEVALRSARKPEEYERVLRSSLEEIERIARLVDGLLLLARADAGVLRMDIRPTDLKRVAEQVYGQATVLAEKKGVDLRLGTVEEISVPADPERLRRVLLNLVENAVKYTPCGGRVTISLGRRGDRAAVRVRDTGMGIAPEERERIFDRFYRSADARARGEGGAGLGLCIARSIVEAHRGTIEVESAPGQGSTFTVLLPLS
ncbi:MAG TPA: heavy metal sensor histidine kinase [Thermodesulfobacteriota bacterium]|nr:heavy metal sensor histidine kinase [Thermodesulfobacteriota bacterium]